MDSGEVTTIRPRLWQVVQQFTWFAALFLVVVAYTKTITGVCAGYHQ